MKIFKKVLFAMAFTFFLTILGILNGVGYHVMSIRQISFTIHSNMGYADAIFYCDIIYNPVLFPFYWFSGAGHLSGNFSMMYVPEAYMPGEYGPPVWGTKPQDRYDTYITYMVTWGITANLICLLFLSLLIEALEKRLVYVVLFLGIIGFVVGSFLGVIIGLFLGVFVIAYLSYNKSAKNFLEKLWISLWE
jgi:hypothetical protein